MKKSTVYSALCVASICTFLFSAGMTAAAWKSQGDTINKITIASVRGQIVEEYEQNQVVYPDATVDKIVQIANTGTADALPRVKIEKVWGSSRDESGRLIADPDLSTDNIEIEYNTNQWVYNSKDGYFYYTDVLKPGDTTVSLFESFTINGENTGGEYRNKYADIIVSMEMVQAAGDGLSYWGTSFEDLGISYRQTEQEELVTTVDFISPDKGFLFDTNGGDLFSDFKNLIPGESRSQVVKVTNHWNEAVEIFLWADFVDQTQATNETRELINKFLREYAKIVITNDNGTVIYDGAIWGNLNVDVDSEETDSMKYPYNLGTFQKDETKKLNISLYLDPNINNEYYELLGLIKWVFSSNADENSPPPLVLTDTPEPTSPPDINNSSEPTSPPDMTNSSDLTNPSTGDQVKVGLYALLMLIAFVMIPVTYKNAKGKKD